LAANVAVADSCTVDGPSGVEPEDVPEQVTAVLLGVAWLYAVSMESSAPAGRPHAVRLARHLAQELDRAVVDRHDRAVWLRSRAAGK
jgi:hypothetical protein